MENTAEQKKATVLVLDDEALVADMTRKLLEKQGYAVLSATTPGEAINMATEFDGRIDLFLTDVGLPGMSVDEVQKRVKEIHPDAKVLYISAYSKKSLEAEGLDINREDVIQKPLSMQNLSEKVRQTLNP